jgi:hypothetical protein
MYPCPRLSKTDFTLFKYECSEAARPGMSRVTVGMFCLSLPAVDTRFLASHRFDEGTVLESLPL